MSERVGADFDPRWDGAFIPHEHWHFHRRLYERYGIVLAPGEFQAVMASIKSGSDVFYRKGETTVHRINLRVSGDRVFVVVRRGRLATVISPGHAKHERARLQRAKPAAPPPCG